MRAALCVRVLRDAYRGLCAALDVRRCACRILSHCAPQAVIEQGLSLDEAVSAWFVEGMEIDIARFRHRIREMGVVASDRAIDAVFAEIDAGGTPAALRGTRVCARVAWRCACVVWRCLVWRNVAAGRAS